MASVAHKQKHEGAHELTRCGDDMLLERGSVTVMSLMVMVLLRAVPMVATPFVKRWLAAHNHYYCPPFLV